MRINLNCFYTYPVSFLRESVLPFLISQEKKIIVIASRAFESLATCYIAIPCYLKNKVRAFMTEEWEEGRFRDGKLIQGKKVYNYTPDIIPNGIQAFRFDRRVDVIYGRTEEGHFDEEGLLHGEGKITYFNDDFLEGNFVHRALQGPGKVRWTNRLEGQREEIGVFENSLLNGQGKITYFDVRVEEGEFKDGKLNGQGKITYVNGIIEEGYFIDGVKGFLIIGKTLTGHEFNIPILHSEKVIDMKKRFAEKHEVPTDQQQWSFAGRSLNDDSTFFDCNIQKESTLFLNLTMFF